MKLLGTIQGREVVVLLDSGSSHTFISENVAIQLKGLSTMANVISVQVANGEILSVSSEIINAAWSIQGCQFQSDLKVLPLSSYDMILGYEWLETFSPMKIHWGHKWMVIPYHGQSVVIQGVLTELHEGIVVQLCAIEADQLLIEEEFLPAVQNAPVEVQSLLSKYSALFAPPSGLPPLEPVITPLPSF
ncbi:hypothetical protein QOZ80_2AG0130640 [Eleusine coracana subsp. coracana]|nr:hypothetical protein QOZ80_2AG0130640 [Eleusine coracana subsp. coracana]